MQRLLQGDVVCKVLEFQASRICMGVTGDACFGGPHG